MDYIQHALGALKKAGYKITQPREMIIGLLAHTDKALTAYEIRDHFEKQRLKADVVTIYRVLETLESLSLAHKVLAFSGYIACDATETGAQKNAGESCHHYLLCKICHRVNEVKGEDLSNLETKIAKESRFQIQSHYLEFIGICEACRRKAPQKK